MGVLFAVTFIIFRCIIWPYVSYEFFMDSLLALNNKTIKEDYVAYTFLIFNVGFNLLQILWLSEIVMTAKKLLFSKDGEKFSISRGDTKEADVTKKTKKSN